MGFGFNFADAFTTSEIEGLRNKYKKLVELLQEKIADIEVKIVTVRKLRHENIFEKAVNSTWGGRIMFMFDDKRFITRDQLIGIEVTFNKKLNDAKTNLYYAQKRLEELEELYAKENSKQIELSKGDVSFEY